MTRLAIVSESTVQKTVTRQLAFDAVRAAFEAVADDQAAIFEVVAGSGLRPGEGFGVKSGVDKKHKIVGLKCGSYWASNNDKGLPAHGSTILLLDPETGFPQVLVSAAYLNGFRTAAANALAVSCLARSDASVLGVIGAGHQAEHEIRAVAEVRELTLIRISTRSNARANWIMDRLQDLDVEIQLTNPETAVRGADIITTITPSTAALVLNEWVDEGTHISAMGADAKGKHELDPALVKRSQLYAEFPRQSVKIGEFQHAFESGVIKKADDICALGLVTLGKAPGRNSDREITIFDSSGIAIQDLTVARAIVDAAHEQKLLEYIDF